MPLPYEFSFDTQLAISNGVSKSCDVEKILLENVSGARSVTLACRENDRSGVDRWVEMSSVHHLAVEGAGMSDVDKCRKEWFGKDGKDHYCDEHIGHLGKCICDCGERGYAANLAPSKWKPKPYYKRQKRR